MKSHHAKSPRQQQVEAPASVPAQQDQSNQVEVSLAPPAPASDQTPLLEAAASEVAPAREQPAQEEERAEGGESALGHGGQATAAPPGGEDEPTGDSGEAAAAMEQSLEGGGGEGAAPAPADAGGSSEGGPTEAVRPGGGGGAPAAEGALGGGASGAQAPALRAPAEFGGESPAQVMQQLQALPPTEQALSWAGVGPAIAQAASAQERAFQSDLPVFTVYLEGEEASPPALDIAAPAQAAEPEEGTGAPAQAPAIAPAQDPGSFEGDADPASALGGWQEPAQGGEDTSENAARVGQALSSVQTSDGEVTTSPGPRPAIPLTGSADPALMVHLAESGMGLTEALRAEAAQAIADAPAQEQVQPVAIDEQLELAGQTDAQLQAPAPVVGMEGYLALGLPAEVQGSFDSINGPAFQPHMAEAQGQLASAEAERDAARASELSRADGEQTRLLTQAQSEQTQVVAEQRQAIQAEQQRTLDAQSAQVAEMRDAIASEQQRQDAVIRSQVQSANAQIDQAYANAEAQAQAEVERGEREAAEKRAKSEREASNRSWWEKATSWVAAAINALASAISAVFDAVRGAIQVILSAAKEFAQSIIDDLVQAVMATINSVKAAINAIIRIVRDNILSPLAEAFTRFVEIAVRTATAAIEQLATWARDGILALAETVSGVLTTILEVFEGAAELALAVAEGFATGDWSDFVTKALEAALQIVGIPKEEFYGMVGGAESTVQSIVEDPGAFLGNILDGFNSGFSLFSDHFEEHLQGGFVEWITGALGDISLPETFDAAGVFSLVTQVIGVDADSLREKAVEHLGEESVDRLEFVWGFLDSAIGGGIEGLWSHIEAELGDLWSTVIGGIQEWLTEKIVVAAVVKVASMFNPVGALVQALMTVWKVISWVRDNAGRMMSLVSGVIGSVADVAKGNTQAMAGAIEGALAGLIPGAIGLLANLLGLGGIAAKVREIIEEARETVSAAIDALIERVKGWFDPDATSPAEGPEVAPATQPAQEPAPADLPAQAPQEQPAAPEAAPEQGGRPRPPHSTAPADLPANADLPRREQKEPAAAEPE
ncbi:MAG: hypothetical protein JXX28_16795, partial [Deltaproteobacteria bacterium]|nr:hypothetical protein [Deltaproteobacteria bacterium]